MHKVSELLKDNINSKVARDADALGIKIKRLGGDQFYVERENEGSTKAFVVHGYGLITCLEILSDCCEASKVDERCALQEIVASYEDDGCEGCGTISVEAVNEARKVLKYEPLPVSDEDEDEDDE